MKGIRKLLTNKKRHCERIRKTSTAPLLFTINSIHEKRNIVKRFLLVFFKFRHFNKPRLGKLKIFCAV